MLDVVMPFNQPASLPFYNPHVHMASNGIVDEIDLLNPSSLYSIHWPPPTDFHLPADWPQPDPFRNATGQPPGSSIWSDPSPFETVDQSLRTNPEDDFGLDSSTTLPSISNTRNRGRARSTRSFTSTTTTSARMRRHPPTNISRDLREQSPRQHAALSSSPTGYSADPHKLSYAQQHAIQPETQYAHGPTAAKRRRLDTHTPPQVIAPPTRPLHSPIQQTDPFPVHHHHHHQPAPHASRQSDYYPSPSSWHSATGSGSQHATSSSPTWPSHHHQPFYAAGPPQHHGPPPMIPLHLQQPPPMQYASPPSPTSTAPLPPHPEYRRGTSAQASYTESSWRSTESVAVPESDIHHPLSEFPPKPYKDGPNAISPWWPIKVVGKIYGSRLEQMPAIENRLARLEDNVDRYIDNRCEQALRNSQLPGLTFDPPPVQTKPKGPSRLFGGRIWPTALARRVKRNRDRDS